MEDSHETNGRKYRSRKQRPCDLCRFRKTQCKIGESDTTCELCKRTDRPCTFNFGPLRREQRLRALTDGQSQSLPGMGQMQPPNLGSGHDQSMQDDMDLHDSEQPWLFEHGAMNVSPPTDVHSGSLPMFWQDSEQMQATNALHSHDYGLVESPNQAMYLQQSYANSMHYHNGNERAVTANVPSDPGDDGAIMADGQHLPDATATSLPAQSSNAAVNELSESIHGLSLDRRSNYSFQAVGLSGEMDPYLLRHYYYDDRDIYAMHKLDFRRMASDPFSNHPEAVPSSPARVPPSTADFPIHFVMTHESMHQQELGLNGSAGSAEEEDRMELDKLVPAHIGTRLVQLFVENVHPWCAVLSQQDLDKLAKGGGEFPTFPIGIRASVYALAAPFMFLDDEMSVVGGYIHLPLEQLWDIAHRSLVRVCHFAHLASLQLCILLLHRQPTNYAASSSLKDWVLSCSAVSIMESLGLNMDPSEWRLPPSEIRLRRRLWWYLFVQHTWQAAMLGRPSHLHSENWSVQPIRMDDFDEPPFTHAQGNRHPQDIVSAYMALCELTLIASDTLTDLYTIRAVSETSDLSSLLAKAQPLRARIETWRRSYPSLSHQASDSSDDSFDITAPIRLSYLTVENLIYRALLRPLVVQQAPDQTSALGEARSRIFENSLTCAKLTAGLVADLKSRNFACFWPPFARFQLCYVSNLTLVCFAQSPSREYALRARELLLQWRKTLRTLSRAWPLAKLSTIRLDAAFWKGIDKVIYGAGPESPAMIVFRELGMT